MHLPLQTIAHILPSLALHIHSDEPIASVLTDSRSLTRAQGTLFFALRTASGDGHRYIHELYALGLRSFVIEEPAQAWAKALPQANFIQVPSSLTALQSLAQYHRSAITTPVLAITGSVGKTVVKEFLHQLLSPYLKVQRSPRSFNSQLGVPLSLLQMDETAQLAIIEAGISQPEEMPALQAMIRPSAGILTAIADVHLEGFPSRLALAGEKLKLFAHAQTLVYPMDSPIVGQALSLAQLPCQLYGWSRQEPSASLYVQSEQVQGEHTALLIQALGQSHHLRLPFADRANVDNALTALCYVANHHPALLPQALEQASLLKSVEMRLEVRESYNGNTIINDAYSCDLSSLTLALDFLRRRAQSSGAKSVLILSGISAQHLDEEALYASLAELLGYYDLGLCIAIGARMARASHLFAHLPILYYDTVQELLKSDLLATLSRSCILIKGSRGDALERIGHALARLEHQTILEVDLSALRHNLAHYRSLLPRSCKLICMIKADGYGLGAIEVARTLEEARADYLAVATTDEGKGLRRSGVHTPIIIMNPDLSSARSLFEYKLEPEVYSIGLLRGLDAVAEQMGITDAPIHIKVDSGMHRLGFLPSDLGLLIEELQRRPRLRVASVFSHLAVADEAEGDAFTAQQIARLRSVHAELQQALGYPIEWHILNTAGIERHAHHAGDMARLGIGLYGVSPTADPRVRQVARLSTKLLQIKVIPAGEGIGYGLSQSLTADGRIGILPIGYADGLPRSLSCGGYSVSVAGVLCPIVGRVCMDTCMIDLSHASEVKEGDRVTIFGDERTPLEGLAHAAGTISYEVLTSLSLRIQRLYYQE